MGWEGMPRRYHIYPDVFQVWHVISSGGAGILVVAYTMPLFYLGWSLLYGERSPDNPWGATGLEWQASSPPPKENFHRMPRIDAGPYMYRTAGHPRDPHQAPPAQPQGGTP
jgi:cytochrome c oxidase subunit 1